MVQTRTRTTTTPESSKPQAIHPLTPAQTHEPSAAASLPLPRRSLRLSSDPDRVSTAYRNPTSPQLEGFLNLRSGKKILNRTMTPNDSEEQQQQYNETEAVGNSNDDVAVAADAGNALTPENSGLINVILIADDSDSDSDDDLAKSFDSHGSRKRKRDDSDELSNHDDDDVAESSGVNVAAENEPLRVPERFTNSNATIELGSGSGERRNENMERFHNIARQNAPRFAFFAPEEKDEVEETRDEIEDWPGPFSTAMKIIRDRGMKLKDAETSSQISLCESIEWVPKAKEGNVAVGVNVSVSVPSLQEMCLKILVKNADAIASLESVPDALRHRLSQLLCDSRRINVHFLELLVQGIPTEIRLRDCSWLTEEQFTECFRTCDTGSLAVLQLDQCGRCLPDYVIVSTLAQSPRHLASLTTLSLTGACRLSDGGLRALVSSAPALRSINLSQCSLLTSASIYILAESLKSLLKELYLDDCHGIDAALIVPALIELEHLEVLSVVGIQTVCDEFIKNYTVARGQNMKELVLKDCTNLTDASIKAIVEHCPELCVLDLMNLHKLTDSSIGHLTNGCRALHTLKLCRNSFSDEAIAAFVETTGGSLKELSLNNIKKVGYHTTLSLANHAKNLHSLDLSWCRNLTDNALGLIVDSCLALRLLKLFGCSQVTDVFLNGHSNLQIQIIGLKMSPVLEHVKVPDPHKGALNYSSVSNIDLAV